MNHRLHKDASRATFIDRRKFLIGAGTIALGSALFTSRTRAQSASGDVVAKTVYGRVRGARKGAAMVFKGIPYAGPPTGEGRFLPAPKPWPWKGVRDALVFGPQAIQPEPPVWTKGADAEPVSSEDCLFLNVWTPAVGDRRNRPVMVYCDGGGFVTNNGGDEGRTAPTLTAPRLHEITMWWWSRTTTAWD